MANTKYDEIYTEFLNNCATDDINLPNTDEKRYTAIQSAIRYFNYLTELNVQCDNTTESVNREFNDNELLLVSHFLRLAFLENQLIHLTTIYSPFQKEIGIKNYQEASRNFKELVSSEKAIIDSIYTKYFNDDYI